MAKKVRELPKPGKQIAAEIRQGEDTYPKGKSGIIIIRKRKRTNLDIVVKRKRKQRKE